MVWSTSANNIFQTRVSVPVSLFASSLGQHVELVNFAQ